MMHKRAQAAAEITSQRWNTQGIILGHSISKFVDDRGFSSTSNDDSIRMHFGLKGDYKFTFNSLSSAYDLIGGHHNILYSPTFSIEVKNKSQYIETFGIQFPRSAFIKYTENASDHLVEFAEKVNAGKTTIFTSQWGSLSPQIEHVIYQIVNNAFQGDFEKLFLLSKSLELLVLVADSCLSASEKEAVFLKKKGDREKMIAARDLITERLADPPTLSELARLLGTNEFKLKKGFKEMFGKTIFAYLREQRLLLSRQLLLDTDQTAANISTQLGYSTPQHFNRDFKKRFGKTPNMIRKNP